MTSSKSTWSQKHPAQSLFKQARAVYLAPVRLQSRSSSVIKTIPSLTEEAPSVTPVKQSPLNIPQYRRRGRNFSYLPSAFSRSEEQIVQTLEQLKTNISWMTEHHLATLRALFSEKENEGKNNYLALIHTALLTLAKHIVTCNTELTEVKHTNQQLQEECASLQKHVNLLDGKLSQQTNENIHLLSKVSCLNSDLQLLKTSPEYVMIQELRQNQAYQDIEKELEHKNTLLAQLRQEFHSLQKRDVNLNKVREALKEYGINSDLLFEKAAVKRKLCAPKRPQNVPRLLLENATAATPSKSSTLTDESPYSPSLLQ